MLNELKSNLQELDGTPALIDISGVTSLSPLSALPVARRIASLVDSGARVTGEEKLASGLAAAARAIAFPHGIATRQEFEKSGETLIPISRVRVRDPRGNNPDSITVGNMLDRYSVMLRTHLSPETQHTSTIIEAISYFLSELAANVEDHADAEEFWLLAQYEKEKEILDICLLDCGVGIPATLKSAGIQFVDDGEAVLKAMQGWSSKNIDGLRGAQRGTGLKTTIRLITRSPLRGEFLLLSQRGGHWLSADGRSNQFRLNGWGWDGTIAWIRIRKPATPFKWFEYIET